MKTYLEKLGCSWQLLCYLGIVCFALFGPPLVGNYFGHAWGALLAMTVLVGWFTYTVKDTMLLSTRIVWVGILILLLCGVLSECARLNKATNAGGMPAQR